MSQPTLEDHERGLLPIIPILWGDGEHNDRPALGHLLCGGAAYDARSDRMILVQGLGALPAGLYLTR